MTETDGLPETIYGVRVIIDHTLPAANIRVLEPLELVKVSWCRHPRKQSILCVRAFASYAYWDILMKRKDPLARKIVKLTGKTRAVESAGVLRELQARLGIKLEKRS